MSVFQSKNQSNQNVKNGSKTGFVTGAIMSTAILVSAIFGSCAERDNPIGFKGSDTTRIVTTQKSLDSTERKSPYSGKVLLKYNSVESILSEDSIVTLSTLSDVNFKVKFDYINKSPANQLRAETDVKIYNQNDSLIISERSLMKGSYFVNGKDTLWVLAIDVRSPQDKAKALMGELKHPQNNEKIDQKILILNEGNTSAKFSVKGQNYLVTINANLFVDFEKTQDRVQIDNIIYARNFQGVTLNYVATARFMDAILWTNTDSVSFILYSRDNDTKKEFSKTINNINLLNPVFKADSLQGNSKGPNYQIRLAELNYIGLFESGHYDPFVGYIDGYYPTLVTSLKVQQVVNNTPRVETENVTLENIRMPNYSTPGSYHLVDLNSTLGISSFTKK